MDSEDLEVLIGELKDTKSADEIKDICERFSSLSKLERFLFGICDVSSLSSPKISTTTNYPSGWFTEYFKGDYVKNDPVVKYCFENISPVRWDRLVLMEEYSNAAGEEIMERAKEHGLASGFSIPVKAPSGEIAIFSLATEATDDAANKLMSDVLPHAQCFAYSLVEQHTKLICSSNVDLPKVSLSKREKECLFWACEGKTAWEMSKILSITERTVIFHLTAATKKLGATNRQHAVAKAILHGFIKPEL